MEKFRKRAASPFRAVKNRRYSVQEINIENLQVSPLTKAENRPSRPSRRSSTNSGPTTTSSAPPVHKYKRSLSLSDGLASFGFARNKLNGVQESRIFEVECWLPNGEKRKLLCLNGMLICDLVRHLVLEFAMDKHQICTSSPRQLVNPEAEATLIRNQTISLENPDRSYLDELLGDDARFNVVLALLKSECLFQDQLRSIFDVYAEPLRKFSSISSDDHRILFTGIEPILAMSSSLCSKMEAVLKTWDAATSRIGNLFTNKFWMHFDQYYVNYKEIKSVLRKKRETDLEFVQFCKLRRGAARHSLDSLLLLPVQRIPQYDRYLSELMNETEQTHPDYDEISKTAEKVSNMVKERQVETMHAENEYKVESVQDRFPNDDLELNEKDKRVPKIQSRRRSAPSAVLLKTLSSKNKSNQQSSNRPLPFLPDELPTKPQSTHRTYLLESPVRMSEGDQTFDRYMFLFNDLLLVAKKKSPTAFKLKSKIRLSEVWLAHAIDEVSQSSCPLERSFVIGWPTTNYVATFDTTEMRDLWWAKLRSQISIEKRREEPKAIQLKILNRDMQAYASMKTIDVYSGQEANDVIKTCVEQFEIADADLKDYQIWVCSGKDPPNSAYPLIGHEDIYSIKMNHVRDAIKHKGDIFILPCDTDFGSETVPREFQVEFFLKRKGMGCPYFDDGKKKGSKKSPIITLFNRPKAARRESSVPGTSPGKFFGQRLADVSEDDEPPKPIMDLLSKLFVHGPFTQGIFRRSANLRMVRELHEAIDTESDIMVDDIPILVIGDTIKSFLREMPGCIFGDDLYDKFLATNAMADADRADELKRLVENLPRCNQKLLRHLFCVLHHIHLKSQENQMTAYNLAICIGPSLLKTPGKSEDSAPTSPVDTQRESSVVEFMIEHFESIFGHEALYVFGDIRPRQDSSTDSDSLQSSHGRLETNVVLRREDSSSDSLNHDLDSSEMESSPRMGKSHLSPTNLSRDSGLTLSDSQLYDDDVDDAAKYEIGITSQLQRQKRRVSDPANSNTALGGGCQIDTSRLYAKMAVPGNGMLTSNIGQQVDRSRSSPQHQVSLRSQQQAKRQQADSLKAVKEGAVTDFASSDDMGYLKKSASGARLFFDEEYVSTQGPSQSKDSAVQSPPPQSQRPVSPHTYRRMWLTEAMENAPTRSSPDPRSSSPHRQAIQARLSAGVLDDRRRGKAGMSQSAPVTPDQLSPAHRANSPSRSMATSPAHHAGHAPKPHLVVTARRVFEQHFEERRRQQDANQSSSDEERPRRDSRRKLLQHPNVKTMVASLEKSNSDSNVLDRVETSPRHRPEKPPSYQEAIYRQNMLKQSDEHIARHRDRLVTRCLSDHHTTQPQDTLAPSQPQPATNIRRSHSEKDRTGRSESRVKPAPAKDNPNRYSTGAILDSVAPRDYPDSRTSLSPPPRTPVQRTNSDVVRTSSRGSETYRSSRDSETYRTESRKWSPTDNVNYSSEEYFV